jgi:hypothetical protein
MQKRPRPPCTPAMILRAAGSAGFSGSGTMKART